MVTIIATTTGQATRRNSAALYPYLLIAPTMITLVLIPVLYMLFEQYSERAKERAAARRKDLDAQPSPASGD